MGDGVSGCLDEGSGCHQSHTPSTESVGVDPNVPGDEEIGAPGSTRRDRTQMGNLTGSNTGVFSPASASQADQAEDWKITMSLDVGNPRIANVSRKGSVGRAGMGVDGRPGVKGSIEVAGATVSLVCAGPAVDAGYQGQLTERTSTRVAKGGKKRRRKKEEEGGLKEREEGRQIMKKGIEKKTRLRWGWPGCPRLMWLVDQTGCQREVRYSVNNDDDSVFTARLGPHDTNHYWNHIADRSRSRE